MFHYSRLLATGYGTVAAELIAQKRFGEMVSFQPPDIKSVPLGQAIANLRLVGPKVNSSRWPKAWG